MNSKTVAASRRVIVDSVDEILRSHGFARRGKTWTRKEIDTYSVMNLDHSWRNSYNLNLSLFIAAALGEHERHDRLEEHKGHIRVPVIHINPAWRTIDAQQTPLYPLLDAESVITEHRRAAGIREFVEQWIFPFLDRCRTLADLRSLYSSGGLAFVGVHRTAIPYLELKVAKR